MGAFEIVGVSDGTPLGLVEGIEDGGSLGMTEGIEVGSSLGAQLLVGAEVGRSFEFTSTSKSKFGSLCHCSPLPF